MANKTCSAKMVLTYIDDDGNTKTSTTSLTANYQAFGEGTMDVPDTTTSATAFDIPFGSIADGATALEVVNKTGQDMTLKLNGSLALCDLPDGSGILLTAADVPAGTPLTAASLTTTATQAGAGTIAYKVFGDPT
jgi:hypothetical protein